MTDLRKRFVRDLQISNYSKATVKLYTEAIHHLALYYNSCPSQLSEEQLKDYIGYVVNKGDSWSKVNIIQSAMKKFYRDTLQDESKIANIKRPKWESKVRTILSRKEITAILDSFTNIKHKVIYMTMYACGLRVSETCMIKVQDIDSDRMVIQIRNPKGHRQREVIMPEELLFWLRQHIIQNPSRDYLFLGLSGVGHIKTGTVQTIFKRKLKKLKILKDVSTHTLRHSHATHCLEEGSDLLALKRNLGHKSITTTLTYYHLTDRLKATFVSPLETLPHYGKRC